MKWYELKIKAEASLHEALSNRLFELGAEGVQEVATGLTAYFPEAVAHSALAGLKVYCEDLSLGEVEMDLIPVKDENWVEKYKEFYFAQNLSDKFFLKPLWDKTTPVPEGMTAILMEPGQAFGTGLHSSTRLCIRFLERRKFNSAERCLDVGTGTGILAIVMEKLGGKKIEAVDNDPLAVEAAQENLKVNDCHQITASGTDISKLNAGFGLVVSNILLKTHEELAREYGRILPPKAELIVSGLLRDQKDPVDAALKAQGFQLLESEYMDEWAAFRLVKGE
jgi:ribosomal protein L11 methyltransferase